MHPYVLIVTSKLVMFSYIADSYHFFKICVSVKAVQVVSNHLMAEAVLCLLSCVSVA